VGEGVGELQTISRNPFNTEIALLRSSSVIDAAIEELDWRDPVSGELIGTSAFSRNLKVGQMADTDILELAFSSPNQTQAEAAVNTLMEVYIRRNTELNRAEVVAARKFIEGQLPDLKKQVQEATQALQDFKQKNNIVALATESGTLSGRLTALTQQIEELRTQLLTADARAQALREQLNMDADKALALTVAIEDPGIQEVLGNLQTAQTNLTVQQTLYTSEHPTVANLSRQVNALESLLQERLDEVLQDSGQRLQVSDLHLGSMEQGFAGELVQAEVNRASLNEQLQQLTALQEQYARRVQQIPELEVTEQELQDQLALAQTNYQRLRNRLPELVIAESQSMGLSRVEIIERAVAPPMPPPSFNVIYVIAGGVVGVFGGLGLLIFLELIDRSVKTIRDTEAITGHLALGAIAEFTTAAERNVGALVNDDLSPRLVVLRSPESPICESYQMISAALRLRGFGDRFTSLAVVSAIGEEGRSEMLANLAATLAQGRRRVLILDADLRSPSQHLLWKVPNDQGLGNILENTPSLDPATLDPFIHVLNPYLSLLPSGTLPVNPLALLDSQFMMDLVTTLSSRYDWVLVDTPPLTRAADAALLGQMVDGALWVVRTQFVDPSLMVVARALLLKSRTPIVGLVANQVDFRVEAAAYAHFNRQHREAKSGLLDGLLGGSATSMSKKELLLTNLDAEASALDFAQGGSTGPMPGLDAEPVTGQSTDQGQPSYAKPDYLDELDLPWSTSKPVPEPVQADLDSEAWSAAEFAPANDTTEGPAPAGSPDAPIGPAVTQTAQLLHSAAARRARAREVASRRAARSVDPKGEDSQSLAEPDPTPTGPGTPPAANSPAQSGGGNGDNFEAGHRGPTANEGNTSGGSREINSSPTHRETDTSGDNSSGDSFNGANSNGSDREADSSKTNRGDNASEANRETNASESGSNGATSGGASSSGTNANGASSNGVNRAIDASKTNHGANASRANREANASETNANGASRETNANGANANGANANGSDRETNSSETNS
ncbi:MAG: polysaccharide biosynthesis tyrosine autokinase, partial [Prochlorothrix sp.]